MYYSQIFTIILIGFAFVSGNDFRCYECDNCATKLQPSQLKTCGGSIPHPHPKTSKIPIPETTTEILVSTTNYETTTSNSLSNSTDSAPQPANSRDFRKKRDINNKVVKSQFQCFKRTTSIITKQNKTIERISRGCLRLNETCSAKEQCFSCKTDRCNGAMQAGISTLLILAVALYAVSGGTQ